MTIWINSFITNLLVLLLLSAKRHTIYKYTHTCVQNHLLCDKNLSKIKIHTQITFKQRRLQYFDELNAFNMPHGINWTHSLIWLMTPYIHTNATMLNKATSESAIFDFFLSLHHFYKVLLCVRVYNYCAPTLDKNLKHFVKCIRLKKFHRISILNIE